MPIRPVLLIACLLDRSTGTLHFHILGWKASEHSEHSPRLLFELRKMHVKMQLNGGMEWNLEEDNISQMTVSEAYAQELIEQSVANFIRECLGRLDEQC
ncbi:unnamed protein product [Caenorhabditis sp. 36 PRJEB53466]|nr:unnamed protein product [Caenorhabditis sp. 36 PRJEB53466]